MTNKEFEELNKMNKDEEWGHKFTKYDIDPSKCTEDTVADIKAAGIPTEPKLFLTAAQMKAFGVSDGAIIFDGDSHFDKADFQAMIEKCVKSAKHYLVYKHHVTWNGLNSHSFHDSMESVVEELASVEGSMYFRKVYNKGKGMKFTVVNHEKPDGHGLYIVALNDKEYKAFSESVTYHDFKGALGIE